MIKSRRLNKKLTLGEEGFTLLEVLIAMAIMLVALSSILSIESNSINASARAKQMNVIAMLARNEMIDTEFAIEGRTFDEMDKEKTGNFDAPYEQYSWKREIKDIEFPPINPAAMAGAAAGGDASQSQQQEPNEFGADTLAKLITNYLSKAMKEVVVTIIWKQSGKQQTFVVSTYWVDLNHAFELTPQ